MDEERKRVIPLSLMKWTTEEWVSTFFVMPGLGMSSILEIDPNQKLQSTAGQGPGKELRAHQKMDDRWNNALPEPVDHTPLSELPSDSYCFTRPLYRCSACLDFGEKSLHRYVDECPSFVEVRHGS